MFDTVNCLLVSVVIFSQTVDVATGGSTCLDCLGVADPELCNTVTECWPSEECYVDHFLNLNGTSWYNLGCKHKEECSLIEGSGIPRSYRQSGIAVTLCQKCCLGNLCNVHKCENDHAAADTRLTCFNCQHSDDPMDCRTYMRCKEGETCFAESIIDHGPEPHHNLGCIPWEFCRYFEPEKHENDPFTRQRRLSYLCQQCCYATGCNRDLCAENRTLLSATTLQTVPATHMTTHDLSVFSDTPTHVYPHVHPTEGLRHMDVRIVDGPTAGRLEVNFPSDGTIWGTVCDNKFTEREATVACRTIFPGQPNMIGTSRKARDFESLKGAPGPILLKNVYCKGYETSLSQCYYEESHLSCSHSMDAGILCSEPDRRVRLTNYMYTGTTSLTRLEGSVEILQKGEWGVFCGKRSLNETEAAVICRMLGAESYGAKAIRQSFFAGDGPRMFHGLSCYGDELSIYQCRHDARIVIHPDCHGDHVDGVSCHPGPSANGCPDMFNFRHNDTCYYIMPQHTYISLLGGIDECEIRNSSLVAIETADERDFLIESIKSVSAPSNSQGVSWFTSGFHTAEFGWRWNTTGERIDVNIIPRDLHGWHPEPCLAFTETSEIELMEIPCTSYHRHVLCETPARF